MVCKFKESTQLSVPEVICSWMLLDSLPSGTDASVKEIGHSRFSPAFIPSFTGMFAKTDAPDFTSILPGFKAASAVMERLVVFVALLPLGSKTTFELRLKTVLGVTAIGCKISPFTGSMINSCTGFSRKNFSP